MSTSEDREPPLFAAPHRPMFLSGCVVLLAAFALWMLELVARASGAFSFDWRFPSAWMHVLTVASGALPLLIFGFLLTAMPRWQSAPAIVRRQWLPYWSMLACGWLLGLSGGWVSGLLAPGLLLVLAGWTGILWTLFSVLRAPANDRFHAGLVCLGVLNGWIALCIWFGVALGAPPSWARLAISISVWWSLVPVFVTVCHRMIPFFSAGVASDYTAFRPRAALGALIGGSFAHGAMSMAGMYAWTWLVDLPVAVIALWLSWRWWPGQAMRVRLLAMLHIGFVWLGVGMLLGAAQSVFALSGMFVLGHGPLHAVVAGFFGSIVFAMVSRVTLGHSGSALEADAMTWWLFIGLQVVVVLRIVADMLPQAVGATWIAWSAAGWFVVFGAWAVRYLPVYWRPRVDGRPG